MFRFSSAMILGATLGFVPTLCDASIIATETFSYPTGNLAGNSGGIGFSTAWGNANSNVATGSVQVNASGQAAGSSNIFRGLSTTFGTTGEIWMSFDFTRTAGAYDGISLFNGTAERFLIGTVNTSTFWALGRNGLNSAGNFILTDDLSATMKTGVIRFSLASGSSGTADLWVGTGVGSVNVSGTPDATLTGLTLGGINTLRIGSDGAQVIDNIALGTTSADVAAIPEPSTIFLSALGLAAFGIITRRKKLPV